MRRPCFDLEEIQQSGPARSLASSRQPIAHEDRVDGARLAGIRTSRERDLAADILGKLLDTGDRKQELHLGNCTMPLVYNSRAFKGARKTMIESRFSVTLAAAFVFAAVRRCARLRRGRGQGIGRGRRHEGRGLHRLPRRQRQQLESGMAEPRRTKRRLYPRAARDVQGQEAQQPDHVARSSSRSPNRTSPISPNSSPRRRRPASKPILPTGRRARRCTGRATPRATSRPARPATAPPARAMRARVIRHFARSTRSTP